MTSNESKTLCKNCLQHIESSKIFLHERMCYINVKRCPKCEKPFNIDDLNDHVEYEHSLSKCDLCGKEYIRKELDNHKINCEYRLIPCKYCQLNVIFIELEEHENMCGSITKKCEKCGLYIEQKKFDNHICQKQESQYLNDYIKIEKIDEEKKEKKKTKKKYNKKNKIKFQNNEKENEIWNELNNNIDDLNLNMILTPKEMNNQIKAMKQFEDKKNNEITDKKVEDKKEKKKKKNKKDKEMEKEDVKEEDSKKNKKNKKGKKNKNVQNKYNKNLEEYSDEEDNYNYNPTKKKIDLHNLKFDLLPEEYRNNNKNKNLNNNGYNNFILEEKMILEAINQSLLDK